MKRWITLISGSLRVLAAWSAAATTPTTGVTTGPAAGSTAGVLCDYRESTYNADESVKATSTKRILSANGIPIPNHAVGTFPNAANPNTISAQSVSHESG